MTNEKTNGSRVTAKTKRFLKIDKDLHSDTLSGYIIWNVGRPEGIGYTLWSVSKDENSESEFNGLLNECIDYLKNKTNNIEAESKMAETQVKAIRLKETGTVIVYGSDYTGYCVRSTSGAFYNFSAKEFKELYNVSDSDLDYIKKYFKS